MDSDGPLQVVSCFYGTVVGAHDAPVQRHQPLRARRSTSGRCGSVTDSRSLAINAASVSSAVASSRAAPSAACALRRHFKSSRARRSWTSSWFLSVYWKLPTNFAFLLERLLMWKETCGDGEERSGGAPPQLADDRPH